MESNQEIMIVAGEASGDMHGANLLRAMREISPGLHCSGMGGPALVEAGMELLWDAASIAVVGAFEVIAHLGDILTARKTLLQRMREHRPALLILIDYPDFNLLLARQAKKLGIPVLYYISPQIWAWRKRRVHSIARLTDRVAVILPFEQDFYKQYGYEVDFVGHPLMDTVKPQKDEATFRRELGVDDKAPLVGLLPGSRRKEIATLLPIFLQAAKRLAEQNPNLTFLLPKAPTINRELLDAHGLAQAQKELDIRLITEDRYTMMSACQATMAASGTVLLELAILGVPTVATYRVSPMTYRLGRLLIRGIKYFSLVNLIGERAIIPELLQDEVTPQRIAQEMAPLLEESAQRNLMLDGFNDVKTRLGGPGASERAAMVALELLDTHRS
nr:lipid-A-disaccharide synthase [uncultured Desulfobulbus sp.]